MDKISNSYMTKLKTLSNNRKDRIKQFITTAEIWEAGLMKAGHGSVKLVCSSERLESAISSYFYDIIRYKEFHGMIENDGKINFPKIYAFTSKWIVKEKPFYIEYHDLNNCNEKYKSVFLDISNKVNEIILLEWIVKNHKYHSGSDMILSYEESKSLIYNFKFRDIDTGILELFFESRCSKNLVVKY